MAFKKMGKVICLAALSALAFAVPTFSGCNTDHPEMEITISYNGATYTLEYKMYRNMYPQTVQHFIELADSGFYNNTIIHNYTSSYWYGGGYAYSEMGDEQNGILPYNEAYDDGGSELREHLEYVCKEKAYYELANPALGKITPTVYRMIEDGKYVDPLSTLIGEFSNNQHKIENGALKSSYGCLRMYYTSKDGAKIPEVKNKRVYLNKYGSSFGVQGDYTYNSATSLFSIQSYESSSTESSYCIFATLQNSSTLKSLQDAISKNIVKAGTKTITLNVDNYDEIMGANKNEASFQFPQTPIIIKSVKVTKY